METRKRPSTIAQAKKAKSKTFYGKGNKKLADWGVYTQQFRLYI